MCLFLIPFFIVCTLFYAYHVASGRLREVVNQYPKCYPNKELPIFGSLYHLITNSDCEGAMKAFLRMGRGAIKAGGIGRIYGFFEYFLVLADLDDAKETLSNFSDKHYLYTFLQRISGNGSVFVPDSSISKVRRQAFLPALTTKRLANYITMMWSNVEWLTDNLEQCMGVGPVAVQKYISGFCYMCVTSAIGSQEINEHVSAVQVYADYSRLFTLVYERITSVWMFFDFVYSFTNNCKETDKYVASFYDNANKIQEIRREKLARQNSLTKDMEDKEELVFGLIDGLINSNILSKKEINDEIIVLIGASEEAALAISFTLQLLAQYPSVQDKLYDEIRDISGDTERPLDKDDLMKMTYLDMVIKESMRLYPPVPFIMRKTDKEIKLSSGRIIPAGVGVVAHIMGIHRNPKHWGSDAEHFDPERFRPGRPRVPDGVHIMPFGYGPRICPATKFGIYIVKVGIIGILKKYKVVGTPAAGPIPTVRAKIDLVLKPVDDVEIQLENRT